jgi:YD repeat-containing protein
MKELVTTVLFIGIIWFKGASQETSVIPPSPVSSQFAKYITQEVSLYNGIPEISVPLYTINLKGLSIPINLSYHASGIKVDQQSTDVGLGWVLNPGYRISRTVYGYADEFLSKPADINQRLNYFNSENDNLGRDRYLSMFYNSSANDIQPYNQQRFDGEYDQFTFSSPGNSGEFIISDRNTKSVTTIEDSNLKFDYKIGISSCTSNGGNTNVTNIIGFQMIDETGSKYLFGEFIPQERCAKETTTAEYEGSITTAWGLTDIVTSQGEQVKFKYTDELRGGWNGNHSKSHTVTEAATNGVVYKETSVSEADELTWNSNYYTFFVSEIATSKERIVFSRNRGYLNNIQIYTSSNALLKTIEFTYNGQILTSISINDPNSNKIETYKFEYYQGPGSTYAKDQWGYYQNASYSTYYHQEFADDNILHCRENNNSIEFYEENLTRTIGSLFLVRNNNGSNFYSLKKIVYPTAGYTTYEYEPNRYVDYDGVVKEGGGIRIKSIESYDSNDVEVLSRYYSYGQDENGYGEQAYPVSYNLFVNERALFHYNYSPSERIIQRMVTYSTEIQGDIGSILNNSGFIKYPCVTEYYNGGKVINYYDLGLSSSASTLSGRIEFPYNASPYYVTTYKLWDKPHLGRRIIYKKNGEQFEPVKEEKYEYVSSFFEFKGLKVKKYITLAIPQAYLQSDFYSGETSIKSFYNYGEYVIETGKNLLKRKFEYEYLNGNTITNEYTYEYSNLFLSKETQKKSTGELIINYTTYPLDYPNGTTFIDDMKAKLSIGFPIEKVSTLEIGSTKSILSGTINVYKAGGKGLIESQWGLESQYPVGLESFKFSNRTTGVLPNTGAASTYVPDEHYKKNLSFDSYDEIGNPLQLHKENDITASYLWSYNNTYPVIKAENVDYSTLSAAVSSIQGSFETFLTISVGNLTTDDQKSAWRSFNTALRSNSSLSKAMITTYTYTPLVGMTSQTDPNGVTTYYEYDSAGRLKCIKDDDGRILKTYEYHYKQ